MMAEIPAKERLMLAGERLFARDGIDRVRIRDLNDLAEVRNDSAVHYYFGSRDGLLEAIVVRHMDDIKPRIEEMVTKYCEGREPSKSALRASIGALTVPFAAKLLDDRGRDFMQIMAEVYERRGGLADAQYVPVSEVAKDLVRRSMVGMSEALREERFRLTINFMVSSMGARARAYDADQAFPLDHNTFVVNLVEMGTMACLAALPDGPLFAD
ncbi:TetR/AcrR family transcriptional regulator [Rhodococcus globerulus]|uniref:TetR family transcriptional regulator n=1 Tax=Rhodococcus globerulus TaxID=33008 RepID=A0ABU4C4Q8_RHOGO|nr:TetR family transcriptional regulator [Rhodococcus globerulus]MDV6271399.1 TetR family transcriptional regulator [Rhodococcus globerulus]